MNAMSDIAFALDTQGQRVPVTNAMIVQWMTIMFNGPDPPEDQWVKIADSLLVEYNIHVAYVNFQEFLQLHAETLRQPAAVADTRPLITPLFREQHPDEWQRLWDQQPRTECPVCHEIPDILDGPMNSDIPTRCNHWVCVDCWSQIAERNRRCPICRDDLDMWLVRHDGDSMDSDSD